MVFSAWKTIDTFLPIDRSTGKKRGFGFVRFRHYHEAYSAIERVQRRSWGGRRISASLACPPCNNTPTRNQTQGWTFDHSDFPVLKASHSPKYCVGWLVPNESGHAVQVAPCLEEKKRKLSYNLVGFLQTPSISVSRVESWLESCWAKCLFLVKKWQLMLSWCNLFQT